VPSVQQELLHCGVSPPQDSVWSSVGISTGCQDVKSEERNGGVLHLGARGHLHDSMNISTIISATYTANATDHLLLSQTFQEFLSVLLIQLLTHLLPDIGFWHSRILSCQLIGLTFHGVRHIGERAASNNVAPTSMRSFNAPFCGWCDLEDSLAP
jgi:hypothetical protein